MEALASLLMALGMFGLGVVVVVLGIKIEREWTR